jgi:ammonia channel protein AmtB
VLVFSFVVSLALAKVLDLTIGIRVSPEVELEGLDSSLHAETAYAINELMSNLGVLTTQDEHVRTH